MMSALNDQEKALLQHAAGEWAAYEPNVKDRMTQVLDWAGNPRAFERFGILRERHAMAREFFIDACKTAKPDTEKMVSDVCHLLLGDRIPLDIYKASTGEVIIPANYKIGKRLIRKVVKNRHDIEVDPSPIRNRLRILLKLAMPHFLTGGTPIGY